MKLNMVEIKEKLGGEYGPAERRLLISENESTLTIDLRGSTLNCTPQPGDVDWLIEALTMAREALRDAVNIAADELRHEHNILIDNAPGCIKCALRAALARVEGEPDVCGCDELRAQLARVVRERNEWMRRSDSIRDAVRAVAADLGNTDEERVRALAREQDALKADLTTAIDTINRKNEILGRIAEDGICGECKYDERIDAAVVRVVGSLRSERDSLAARLKAVREELLKKWEFRVSSEEMVSQHNFYRSDCPNLAALLAEARPEKEVKS